MGGMQGLDFTSVESVLNMHGIKRKKQAAMLDDLILIQKGALEEISNGRKQKF